MSPRGAASGGCCCLGWGSGLSGLCRVLTSSRSTIPFVLLSIPYALAAYAVHMIELGGEVGWRTRLREVLHPRGA